MSHLILPNGMKYRVETLTEPEMDWLAGGEHMCRKLDTVIMCSRCLAMGNIKGALLQGANDESDHTLTVRCGCGGRTFRRAG